MNRINTNNSLHKLTIFVWWLCFSLISAAQNSEQKITIENKNITIKEAFASIEQQTEYTIAYEQSMLNLKKRLSLSLRNASIDKTLTQILEDTEFTYEIKGYHVIIQVLPKKGKTDDKEQKKPVQTIRGVVIDSKTNRPIEYASVIVRQNPSLSVITDSLGKFKIKNVPVGRYDIQTSFMGYDTDNKNEILVTSSKEVNLTLALNENVYSLEEVTIHPDMKKEGLVNTMAITGGRIIHMEEASRFANGFDDPARLSTAFAGVAGEVGTNAIAIRGNSPQFTQWRLEGVEIPNPTHFADLSGLGGGFLSALSTQVMGNSDFYNGAFPAEYSNALSGIFDIQMRSGNNQKYEHTFQLGLLGIDLASEGPINRKQGSSYIFNYRFSTTSLATGDDINLKYQDLSFKLNFPTKRSGTFSIWGLGLIDRNKLKAKEQSEWETRADRSFGSNELQKLAGGAGHLYNLNKRMYIRSALSATYSGDHVFANQYAHENKTVTVGDIRNSKWDIVLNSYLNTRFSSKHVNRSGITITGLTYSLDYKVSPYQGLDVPMEQLSKANGNSLVLSAYSSSVINLSNELTASLGLTTQYFMLNKNWTIEPRLALKWQFLPQQSLSLAYGLHSRRERLDYYFVEQTISNKTFSNRYLDFSKAHHLAFTYAWDINQTIRLKVEPYYQHLFHIPVEANSSFSIINYQEFYLDKILTNKGLGRNYGIDISLEQSMKNGFYYMLTASIFKSRYRGGDNIWRATRFDKGFIMNFLAGKEWMVGRLKKNVFGINARLFLQGGDRYTPVDERATHAEQDIVFDESKAFSKKFSPSLNGDLSVNYRINKRKVSYEFSLKMLNVGMRTGMHFYEYNERTKEIKQVDGLGMIPNISFKIYF